MIRRGAAVLCYVAVALFFLRDFIAGGVPGLRHDWNWPVVHVSPLSILSFGISPWVPIDIGGSQLYPSLVPLLALEAALNAVLSPSAALVVLLCGLFALSGLAVYALCRTMNFSRGPALAAGIFYMSAPAIYDNVIAGHIGDLCIFAGLPLFACGIAAARRELTLRAVAISCMGALIASIQLQGFVLVLLCAVLLVPMAWNVRSTAASGVGIAAMVLANLNSFVGLVSDANAGRILRQNHAVLSWESAQSAALLDALMGRGYFAGYDKVWLPASVLVSLACVTIVALAIYGLRKREWLIGGFLAVYACGVVIISGLNGPGSAAWTWFFVHVSATSLFRELFHAAAFIVLPMSLGFAVIAQYCVSRFAVQRYAALAAALLALAIGLFNAMPSLTGTSHWLYPYPVSADQQNLYRMLASDPTEYRYTFFPGRQPYALNQDTNGVDAGDYYPIGSHAPIFGYFPYGPIAYASDHLASGDTLAANRMLERLSVRYVLYRRVPRPALAETIAPGDNLPSAQFKAVAPQRDRIAVLPAVSRIRVGSVPLLLGGGFEQLRRLSTDRIVAFARQQPEFVGASPGYYRRDESLGRVDEAIAAGCMSLERPLPSVITASPRKGWVEASRFGFELPRLDDEPVGAILTVGPRAVPDARRDALALIYRPGMPGFQWVSRASFDRTGGVRAVAAVAAGVPSCRLPKMGRRYAPPVLIYAKSEGVTKAIGELRSHGHPGALAFTDAFDPNWHLSIDGRPVPASLHFHADGWGNGWIVDVPAGDHEFEISYAGAARYESLLLIEAGVWAVVLVLLTVPGRVLGWRR